MGNWFAIFTALQEIVTLVNKMQADGTFQSLVTAVQAAQTELQSPQAQDLISKVEALFAKKA